MTDVLEQIDFVILEQELEGPPSCESVYEKENQVPEHPAHYYVTAPCGDIIAVCERRRRKARNDGGWYCTIKSGSGCTGYHDYDVLEFTRV